MAATKIIKGNTVKLGKACEITNQMAEDRHQARLSASSAEIIGQEDNHIVILVRCGCGQEIQLQCRFDPPGAVA